jgi:hypothetical protein
MSHESTGVGEHLRLVSERLGHASVQLTSDTYQHCSPTMPKAAATKMGAIFAGFTAPLPAAAAQGRKACPVEIGYRMATNRPFFGPLWEKERPHKLFACWVLCLLAAAGIEPATRGL